MNEVARDPEFDVFLSHHSGDKPWAVGLKAALVARGIKVWLDKDEILPGDLYIDALADGVRRSRCLAVIVSPASVKSAWVKREWHLALKASDERGTRLIPCLLRDALVPDFLDNIHYTDFRDVRDAKQFEARVDELARAIMKGRSPIREAPPLAMALGRGVADEIEYLDQSIARIRKYRVQLAAMWVAASGAGLGAATLIPELVGVHPAIPYLGCTLVTGLFGYGVTAKKWSISGDDLKVLSGHRDALDFCRKSFSSACPRIVESFNGLLLRRAGIVS